MINPFWKQFVYWFDQTLIDNGDGIFSIRMTTTTGGTDITDSSVRHGDLANILSKSFSESAGVVSLNTKSV
jgi:hypothetical protein